ncbi:RDD family protein [Peribacillus sp. SCS-26]|uniref:RDD family protein n=1 Tax=Paraperibacillus marinus TaxID=3115295 RepID=UPI003906486F
MVIIGVPLAILDYFLFPNSDQSPISSGAGAVYSLIIPTVWYGYTVGKKIMGIRIAKVNGGKVGIGTMLMRNLVGGLIYGLTIGIALIVSAFMVGMRKDKRALHDLIAGTYVTSDAPAELSKAA